MNHLKQSRFSLLLTSEVLKSSDQILPPQPNMTPWKTQFQKHMLSPKS